MSALVGPSGAGKSTIINLIPRFYDIQEGSIEIDGQKIESVTLNSLRKNISLVSQDVILFDDTVKNNIIYANLDASEVEMVEACKFAAADGFINKLPQGYNTKIGENNIINSKALLEHDVVVGDNCHISTNSTINGHTKIGDDTFIGSNATLVNNIKIAKSNFVKAGSLIKKSLK